jgi:hypothetical protein
MLHLTFIFLEEDYILNTTIIIISWRRQPKKFFLQLHLRTGKKNKTDVRKITFTMGIYILPKKYSW